jgi:gliding motility-associated lipoprotein GldH
LVTSCTNTSVYNQNIDIPAEVWSLDSTAIFKVDINDTISAHSIYVNVRNTTDYRNCNLYLFIRTTSPQGATLTDTLECILADKRGKWLGRGFGAIRDNQIPYKRFIRFPEIGTYEFSLQQGMRAQNLKGISSVGVKVEMHKK